MFYVQLNILNWFASTLYFWGPDPANIWYICFRLRVITYDTSDSMCCILKVVKMQTATDAGVVVVLASPIKGRHLDYQILCGSLVVSCVGVWLGIFFFDSLDEDECTDSASLSAHASLLKHGHLILRTHFIEGQRLRFPSWSSFLPFKHSTICCCHVKFCIGSCCASLWNLLL